MQQIFFTPLMANFEVFQPYFCSSHVIDLSMNATYLHGRRHRVYTSSKSIHNPFAMLICASGVPTGKWGILLDPSLRFNT